MNSCLTLLLPSTGLSSTDPMDPRSPLSAPVTLGTSFSVIHLICRMCCNSYSYGWHLCPLMRKTGVFCLWFQCLLGMLFLVAEICLLCRFLFQVHWKRNNSLDHTHAQACGCTLFNVQIVEVNSFHHIVILAVKVIHNLLNMQFLGWFNLIPELWLTPLVTRLLPFIVRFSVHSVRSLLFLLSISSSLHKSVQPHHEFIFLQLHWTHHNLCKRSA